MHSIQDVPVQQKGTQTNAVARKKSDRMEEARKLFAEAKNRLLDINRWKEFSGPGSGNFILTDASGHQIFTSPEMGNLIKINLPAPRNKTGDGYEWVRIEGIESEKDWDREWEHCSITVRPVPNPQKKTNDIAHFYTNESTSTFIVERIGKLVFAAERGRNEVPNVKVTKLKDRIRNAVVAFGAMLGFANIQWKKLVRGFLNVKR